MLSPTSDRPHWANARSRITCCLALVAPVVLIPFPAAADPEAPVAPVADEPTEDQAATEEQESLLSPLEGKLTAGFVSASGNSETRTINFALKAAYDIGRFKHNLTAKTLQTRDEGETTVERYNAGYKLDFSFTEADYAFFAADYEKDLFGGIRRRTSQTVGYGRRLIDTSRHEWNVEIGAGLQQIKLQEPDGSSESEAVGSLATDYAWQITETSAFAQTLSVASGASNTAVESESALELSIVGDLFASLSYTVQYNSDVASGTEKTDTYTAVNLNYSFGS